VSIRVMTAVWDHADASGGELVVLLAMADWADDEGRKCFPKQVTLAKKARMTDRGVRKCLASLVEKGYIERIGRLGGGPVEWAVHPHPVPSAVTSEQSSDRNPSAGQIGTPVPTDPSLDPPCRDISIEISPSSASTEPSRPTSEQRESNVKSIPAGSCMSNDKGSMGGRDALAAPGASVLCDRLAKRMRQRDPKAKTAERSTRWLEAADRLMRIDGREFEEAMKVLEFSQADQFWQTVILSMPKFREKYGALRAKWLNTQVRSAAAAQPQATVAELMAAYERPRTRTGV
jgi:hypothetical protein